MSAMEATQQDLTKVGRGRGFGAMSPQRLREVASMGGRAAHAAGTAHQFTAEEARAAWQKGRGAAALRREGGASDVG